MSVRVTCRFMRPDEERQVLALVVRGFDEFVRRDFTQEGVDEFLRATRSMVFGQPPNHFVMVAESEGQLAGMIDLKNNSHISLFFVASPFQRRGVGRALLDHAVIACRLRNPEVSEISVHSSLWAVPVYEKLGFRQTKPRQERNGILFVEMVRTLAPPGG